MKSYRTLLIILLTLIGINVFPCFGCEKTVNISSHSELQKKMVKPETRYNIQKDIDLKGAIIKVPFNSTLVIKKGSLRNGTIVFNKTELNCKEGAFLDIVLQGTISNRELKSTWVKCTEEYSDMLSDAIKVACNSNCDFVFSKGTYKFKKPIFIYNKMSLLAKGKVILVPEISSPDGKGITFIIAGNDALNLNGHVKGMKWEGNIKGISILVTEKQREGLDSFIGLYNASNCTISDCEIDASRMRTTVAHFIGAFNNARYANPCGGSSIRISNNWMKCQGSLEYEYSYEGKLLSCESIGVGDNRKDIFIENNHIVNASDDLGVHTCQNIVIRNNVIESLDGRIYVSGTQDCVIENNKISYISPSRSGMGIKVTMERPYQKPNLNYQIIGNVIDYTKASMEANYGIWVQGRDMIIEGNALISNGASNARIWVDVIDINDNQDSRSKNKGKLVPDNITIKNNKAKILYFVADTKYDVQNWRIESNEFSSDQIICNRKEAVMRNNKIKK